MRGDGDAISSFKTLTAFSRGVGCGGGGGDGGPISRSAGAAVTREGELGEIIGMTAIAIPPTTITANAANAALHRRLGLSRGTSSSTSSTDVDVDVDVVVVVDVDFDGDGNGNVVATVDGCFFSPAFGPGSSAALGSIFGSGLAFGPGSTGGTTIAGGGAFGAGTTAGTDGNATTSAAAQASVQNAMTFPARTRTCFDLIGSNVFPHVGHTASRALTGTPGLSLRRAAR
jgi:hypothetical protein